MVVAVVAIEVVAEAAVVSIEAVAEVAVAAIEAVVAVAEVAVEAVAVVAVEALVLAPRPSSNLILASQEFSFQEEKMISF